MGDPGTKTAGTGAARHADLYQVDEEARGLSGEARKLGLGFWLVFCLFFGGVSLLLNQVRSPQPVISFQNAGEIGPVDSAGLFELVWANGQRASAAGVVNAPLDWAAIEGTVAARLVVDRELVAVLLAPEGAPQAALETVRFADGVDLQAQPGHVYAWEQARLARVIPTRAVIVLGAVLGVLCFVPGLNVWIYRGWMGGVARPLAWINTRLILTILFLLMFSPAALVLAIRRALNPEHDALSRTLRPKAETYWSTRETRDRKHFEHWF